MESGSGLSTFPHFIDPPLKLRESDNFDSVSQYHLVVTLYVCSPAGMLWSPKKSICEQKIKGATTRVFWR